MCIGFNYEHYSIAEQARINAQKRLIFELSTQNNATQSDDTQPKHVPLTKILHETQPLGMYLIVLNL